jgi:hypothetical protein
MYGHAGEVVIAKGPVEVGVHINDVGPLRH